MIAKMQEKEASKKASDMGKQANTILVKITPAIGAAEQLLAKSGIELVASPLKAPVIHSLKTFKEWEAACRSALAGDTSVRLPDVKTNVMAEINVSKKASQLVVNMLSTIAKVKH